MNKVDEKKIKALIHKLGLKYKLSDHLIKELVESPYEFSAERIRELRLDDLDMSANLEEIKSNFMYTGFAKLFINPLAFRKKMIKNKLRKNK